MRSSRYTSSSSSSSSQQWRRSGGMHMNRRKKRFMVAVPMQAKNPQALSTSTTTLLRKRLKQLQRIINPAAHDQYHEEMNNLGSLFEKTANYIFLLEAKLNLLKSLSTIYGV